MNLMKSKWGKEPIGNLCNKVTNIPKNEMNGEFTYIEIGAINSTNNKIETYERVNWNVASPNARQVIFKNDILCSTVRINLKKIAMVDKQVEDGIATVGFCVIRSDIKKAEPRYLFQVCLSDYFTNKLLLLSSGTTYPIVKNKDVLSIEIPLPPLEEQKQIAALFQSIETAIEQVDGQEKNLKALQKYLVNGLLSKEPEFGNILNSKNCTATTFGEIAECDKKYPEHEKEVERFVGLEWIEADNFQLQGFGLIANGTTFSKRFVKDDVLFGKRRAYLKKVAVADFDGICSGDILVIRAKAKKMLQGLLPYYISADAFIQHAVSTSAGSLSPRTKWKDLADLEVSIPDLKKQSTILEVLQQLDNTVNQLKQQKTTLKNLKQKLLKEILG
jgi:type I restriction enzyme S subunit